MGRTTSDPRGHSNHHDHRAQVQENLENVTFQTSKVFSVRALAKMFSFLTVSVEINPFAMAKAMFPPPIKPTFISSAAAILNLPLVTVCARAQASFSVLLPSHIENGGNYGKQMYERSQSCFHRRWEYGSCVGQRLYFNRYL